MNYKSRFTSEIISNNKIITNNKLNSLFLKNQGIDNVRVFDNMVLKPGEEFWLKNIESNIFFTEDIQIVFEGIDPSAKLLVMKFFVEQI